MDATNPKIVAASCFEDLEVIAAEEILNEGEREQFCERMWDFLRPEDQASDNVSSSQRERGAGVIPGNYAILMMTTEAGLAHPERIRATNMRRFMATMSQGLDISPQQQQWVVDHMGHTLDVHHIHYRSTLDVIERIDITKILLMMDCGQIGRFKGKKIEEIKLEDLIDQSEVQSALPEQKEEEEEYVPDLPQEEDEQDAASLFGAGHSEKKSRKRKFSVRHTWTPDELQEIHRYFSMYFKKQKTPGEAAIRRAIKKSQEDGGTLWQLPLTSIKSKRIQMYPTMSRITLILRRSSSVKGLH
ncbi:uncharacterized protein [Apostichopus japonicus]|uniref:uncharacterized protein n=1 Tax=Stichopus japonicus TaxID=307972 RepID=UPI003AB5DAA6